MTWTTVPKPTTPVWDNINVQGKEQYDQASITYDDANVFYDGYNPTQWTDVPKPTGSGVLKAGMATGLIMPPTYSTSRQTNSQWTKVSKPTT